MHVPGYGLDRKRPLKKTAALMLGRSLKHVASMSSGCDRSGNALIHGDNLAVLGELVATHAGTVRCAYLDPPYNNGESYRHYYDSMAQEAWIESLTSRLALIEQLLSDHGSVWISIDDSQMHYLKVAADAIFGKDNFVGTIVWERRTTRENRRVFSRNHEYLLVYAKRIAAWIGSRNTLAVTDDVLARYKNPDHDPRGPWQSVTASAQSGHGTPQQFYELKTPGGRTYAPPNGRCWVYTKKKMLQEIATGNIWFGIDGNGVPRIKQFLCDRTGGLAPETLWRAGDVGTTGSAKKQLLALSNESGLFDTPKPEELIRRVFEIATNPGDLVLDPYLGSGTAAAVAHKMRRRYIGIENGDHVRSHCVRRLNAVIAGDPGGISKCVKWRGGGGFDFFRA